MIKIVVLGGTGILGKELKKINTELICVGSEIDIRDYSIVEQYLNSINPDIIVNCIALKSEIVNQKRIESIEVNIIGSANIAKYCLKNSKRLCYISTDYVYPGIKGNYNEEDFLLPTNLYAWTKLAGESSALMVEDHLIIRTSFGEEVFPYKVAFKNLYTSKDYVDIIAQLIIKAVQSKATGVLNVGTEKKSMYEYANKRNKVSESYLQDDKDYSLNLSRLIQLNKNL